MKIKFVLLLLLLCMSCVRLAGQSDGFFCNSSANDERGVARYSMSGNLIITNFEKESVPLEEGTLFLLVCGMFYVVLKNK